MTTRPQQSTDPDSRWFRNPDIFAERRRIRNPEQIHHPGIQADQDAWTILQVGGQWQILDPGWSTLDGLLGSPANVDECGGVVEVVWLTKASHTVVFNLSLPAGANLPAIDIDLRLELGLAAADSFITQRIPTGKPLFTTADFIQWLEQPVSAHVQAQFARMGVDQILALTNDDLRDRLDDSLVRQLQPMVERSGLLIHGISALTWGGAAWEELQQKASTDAVTRTQAKLQAEHLSELHPHLVQVDRATKLHEVDLLENTVIAEEKKDPLLDRLAEFEQKKAHREHTARLAEQARKQAENHQRVRSAMELLPPTVAMAQSIAAKVEQGAKAAAPMPPRDFRPSMQSVTSRVQHSVGLLAARNPGTTTLVKQVGTAWALADRTLATCAHVIDDLDHYRGRGLEIVFIPHLRQSQLAIPVGQGTKHPRYEDPSIVDPAVVPYDIGLIHLARSHGLTNLPLAPAPVIGQLRQGTQVAYCGFPTEGIPGPVHPTKPECDSHSGHIQALRNWHNDFADNPEDRLVVRHNIPATGGASGSPLFNVEGQIVGIICAGTMHSMNFRMVHHDPQTQKEVELKNYIIQSDLPRWPSACMTNFAVRADLLHDLLPRPIAH